MRQSTQTYNNCASATLKDLSKRYDNFILDAYGVFWGSSAIGMLPGAKEAMVFLVNEGRQVGILSNTTQLSASAKEKLSKHGVYEGVHYHFYFTSGEYTRKVLFSGELPFLTPRKTYYLFGLDHPFFNSHLNIFKETSYKPVDSIQDADFIYINIPHIQGKDQQHSKPFIEEIQKLEATPVPVLCPNPDLIALEGSPPHPVIRQGTIAEIFKRYQFPVYYIGKPDQKIYEEAITLFPKNLDKSKTIMIGDTPETDIRGARSLGIDSALVLEGGVISHKLKKMEIKKGIQNLPDEDIPNFVIERFSI